MCNTTDIDYLAVLENKALTCDINNLRKSNIKRFYYLEESNTTHGVYKCFKNFHHAQGDLVYTCEPNSTWKGETPLCEVDYFMDRFRLSMMITAFVIILSMCLLVPDFLIFYLNRRVIRDKMAMVAAVKKYMPERHFSRALPYLIERGEFALDSFQSFQIDEDINTYNDDFMGTIRFGGDVRPKRIASAPRRENPNPKTLMGLMSQAMSKKRSVRDDYI